MPVNAKCRIATFHYGSYETTKMSLTAFVTDIVHKCELPINTRMTPTKLCNLTTYEHPDRPEITTLGKHWKEVTEPMRTEVNQHFYLKDNPMNWEIGKPLGFFDDADLLPGGGLNLSAIPHYGIFLGFEE